jgi:hypothetical protein
MPSTASAINIYRTLVSGLFRRKDFGFVVRGKNLASISRFVAGIRHGRKLRSRINADVTDGAIVSWIRPALPRAVTQMGVAIRRPPPLSPDA